MGHDVSSVPGPKSAAQVSSKYTAPETVCQPRRICLRRSEMHTKTFADGEDVARAMERGITLRPVYTYDF